MNFGIKLQILRKGKRLSQQALAKKLNVSRYTINEWEEGEEYPNTESIIMISDVFNVTLDYLIKIMEKIILILYMMILSIYQFRNFYNLRF